MIVCDEIVAILNCLAETAQQVDCCGPGDKRLGSETPERLEESFINSITDHLKIREPHSKRPVRNDKAGLELRRAYGCVFDRERCGKRNHTRSLVAPRQHRWRLPQIWKVTQECLRVTGSTVSWNHVRPGRTGSAQFRSPP